MVSNFEKHSQIHARKTHVLSVVVSRADFLFLRTLFMTASYWLPARRLLISVDGNGLISFAENVPSSFSVT